MSLTLPDHVQGLLRQGCSVINQHSIEVLIMAPRHQDVFQAAVLLVHSQFRAVFKSQTSNALMTNINSECTSNTCIGSP